MSLRGRLGSTKSSGSNESINRATSSRTVYSDSGTKSFDKEETDEILDEDLADVSEDVSLGNSKHTITGLVEFKESIDSQPNMPTGYIDDAIVRDVLNSSDDRLKRRYSLSTKKKVAFGLIGAVAIISFFAGIIDQQNSFQKRIEKTIEERSTAFEFDDHDAYIEPVSEITETTTVTTTTTETNVRSSILDDEIPLEDSTVFPPSMEQFLVDPRSQKIDFSHETPLFWQVPFVGGVFQNIMTGCSKKVLASHFKLAGDDTMKVHMVGNNQYVNVDLTSNEGIQNAKGLANSGLADVIVSNYVHLIASELFDTSQKGRLFTALKHPVDRCISEYYYILSNNPSTFEELEAKTMNLEEFVSSRFSDKDWMTRFLIGKRSGELVQADLQLAKEILRKRCLIGLHDQIEVSINLFENYFGWTVEGESADAFDRRKRQVISNEKSIAREVFEKIGKVQQGDVVYEKIVNLNKFDMELYWYAHDLFEKQLSWVNFAR